MVRRASKTKDPERPEQPAPAENPPPITPGTSPTPQTGLGGGVTVVWPKRKLEF
jgi:hypothetical protein